jgi:hypothetical protein
MNMKSGDSMFSLWCVIYFTLLVRICKLFIFGVLSGHDFPCLTQAYMTMLPLTTGRNYALSHSAPDLGKLQTIVVQDKSLVREGTMVLIHVEWVSCDLLRACGV